MLIIKVFKLKKLYREFKVNPSDAVASEITDMAKELAILPFVIFGLILALFFILGFTNLIFNPMLFFRIIFVLGVIVFIPVFIIVRILLQQIFTSVKDISGKVIE